MGIIKFHLVLNFLFVTIGSVKIKMFHVSAYKHKSVKLLICHNWICQNQDVSCISVQTPKFFVAYLSQLDLSKSRCFMYQRTNTKVLRCLFVTIGSVKIKMSNLSAYKHKSSSLLICHNWICQN